MMHVEVNYFPDGEGVEYDVTLTEAELLGALPLFLPIPMTKEKLDLFVEKIRLLLLMDKCLQLSRDMI